MSAIPTALAAGAFILAVTALVMVLVGAMP